MCSLPRSCGQLQVKTSTCHHTLKGYVCAVYAKSENAHRVFPVEVSTQYKSEIITVY